MTFAPRKSFLIRVDRERSAAGRETFDLRLLLVKTRRVNRFPEHRVILDNSQATARSPEEALHMFLELRNDIVGAGFPEFIGGHILGPLASIAEEQGLPATGLSGRGEERHEREVRKRGEVILK